MAFGYCCLCFQRPRKRLNSKALTPVQYTECLKILSGFHSYYRRFLEGLSKIAGLVHYMVSLDVGSPKLTHLLSYISGLLGKFHPFRMDIDGNTQSLAAILCQNLKPLPLKIAKMEKFKGYLLVTEFTVITNTNKSLCHLNTAKWEAVKQKWMAHLASFDFRGPVLSQLVECCS